MENADLALGRCPFFNGLRMIGSDLNHTGEALMPWFPQNKYFWDFWMVWDGEQRLHLFYLQASQLDCRFNPELRHDRATVGHAVLTPWGWQELTPDRPILQSSDQTGDWDDLSIWTGSIIHNPLDHRYYLFYTARRRADAVQYTPHEWQRSQNIGVATSTDLSTWQRLAPINLVIPNPGYKAPFDGINWRDPYILQDPDDGRFHAFICAHADPAQDAGGIIATVTSRDLAHWHPEPETLIKSEDFYQMEVPQVFWRVGENGYRRLYLLFCAQAKDCSRHWRQQQPPSVGTYYHVSEPMPLQGPVDYAQIPWQGGARLLSADFYAGKLVWPLQPSTAAVLAAQTSAVFFGFQWADEGDRFVGGLSDPMPVHFAADGTLSLEA
jgi:beta-fructofuranosidase